MRRESRFAVLRNQSLRAEFDARIREMGTRNNHDFADVIGRVAWIAARAAA
jgi:hypothetical protein